MTKIPHYPAGFIWIIHSFRVQRVMNVSLLLGSLIFAGLATYSAGYQIDFIGLSWLPVVLAMRIVWQSYTQPGVLMWNTRYWTWVNQKATTPSGSLPADLPNDCVRQFNPDKYIRQFRRLCALWLGCGDSSRRHGLSQDRNLTLHLSAIVVDWQKWMLVQFEVADPVRWVDKYRWFWVEKGEESDWTEWRRCLYACINKGQRYEN
ncbi:MAG: hypothetical protein QM520_02855 [Gammaproteobacteria bacterium]|nr:hypothetical protein [Gammaproteobacteria bacterium]